MGISVDNLFVLGQNFDCCFFSLQMKRQRLPFSFCTIARIMYLFLWLVGYKCLLALATSPLLLGKQCNFCRPFYTLCVVHIADQLPGCKDFSLFFVLDDKNYLL